MPLSPLEIDEILRSDHDHDTDYAGLTHAHGWSSLTGVPAGFADDVDDDTTYTAGSGLSLAGSAFAVDFAGMGAAGIFAARRPPNARAYTNTMSRRLIGIA